MIRSKLLPVGVLSLVGLWPAVAPAASSQADIPYATSASGEALRLDLYLPEPAGAPLLVWVHGGAWENGNKSAMPMAPFVERGFAVASLDFSPASKARFPGQVHEIKAAIRSRARALRLRRRPNRHRRRLLGAISAVVARATAMPSSKARSAITAASPPRSTRSFRISRRRI
jgi:hypothetical protein